MLILQPDSAPSSIGRLTAGSWGAPTAPRPAGRRPTRPKTSSDRCQSSTSGPCRSSLPRPRPRGFTGRAARATARRPPPTPTRPPCPCRTSRPRRTHSAATPPPPLGSRRRSAGEDVDVTSRGDRVCLLPVLEWRRLCKKTKTFWCVLPW